MQGCRVPRRQCIIMQTVRVPSKLFPACRGAKRRNSLHLHVHVCVWVCLESFVQLPENATAADVPRPQRTDCPMTDYLKLK